MGCAKVLGVGAGVMFGGIMALQMIGEMAGGSATNAPAQAAAKPAATLKAERLDVSARRAAGSDQGAAPRKVASPATDKETADMLAINIILNGYGCHKVTNWRGDGFGGKNIVTCVERKGRSKVVRYEVEPLEGSAVLL